MPAYDASGRALNCVYKTVAASQTTANISTAGDGVKDRDYLDRLIVTWASSAGGAVTLLDGTTNIAVVGIPGGPGCPLAYTLDVGVYAQSTKGFNITTGSCVSVVAVGRF